MPIQYLHFITQSNITYKIQNFDLKLQAQMELFTAKLC